jgi:hypothetical protein
MAPESKDQQAETGQYVFVISQIGDKGTAERKRADEMYDYVIAPAVSQYELISQRSDHDRTPGVMTTQIIKGIIEAKAVVADLTGRNPNVFFELGVAEAFAKPLVLLIKDANSLPFDVMGERTIVVGDGDVLGVAQADEASKALFESLKIVLAPDYVPTNLVTEVASARSLDALAPDNPIASEVGALREVMEEVRQSVKLTNRRIAPRPQNSNFTQLREFVERMVLMDRINQGELSELISEKTSTSFDTWVVNWEKEVENIEAQSSRPPSTYSFDEEPF